MVLRSDAYPPTELAAFSQTDKKIVLRIVLRIPTRRAPVPHHRCSLPPGLPQGRLTASPGATRAGAGYCLCLLMVEAGLMRLVEKVPGEHGKVCVFAPCRDGKTVARVKFRVTRPALSRDQEAALIDVIREILKEEGEM